MTFAKMKSKSTIFFDIEAFEHIRNKLVGEVVAHQARVAVHHHQTHILVPAHQQREVTTVSAGGLIGSGELHSFGWCR